MICPACNKLAKQSFGYPGIFVCNCTGKLEDINLLKPTKTQQSYFEQDASFFVKQIYGEGVSEHDKIDVDNFEPYWSQIFPKSYYQSMMRVKLKILKRNFKTKLFHGKNGDRNFLIFVNEFNLIPDGRCIFHNYPIGSAKLAQKEFDPIKRLMIQKGILDPLFFKPTNTYLKSFNDYLAKSLILFKAFSIVLVF